MSYFQPATLSPALKSTLFYIVFFLSLVGRPVGAALFGHYGDKLGRRSVTIISIGGFALVTLLIGLLPGYENWGIASIVILVLLRFESKTVADGSRVLAVGIAGTDMTIQHNSES